MKFWVLKIVLTSTIYAGHPSVELPVLDFLSEETCNSYKDSSLGKAFTLEVRKILADSSVQVKIVCIPPKI